MKPMVLCISRTALDAQGISYPTSGIFDFNVDKVDIQDFHFINRKVVDSPDDSQYKRIGLHLPQILPYIVITDGKGKYLSYNRNGTETRLYGNRSIGVGGHVDVHDALFGRDGLLVPYTLDLACTRELSEEILYDDKSIIKFTKLIVDTSNPVGKVHVGLFTTLVYPNAQPQEELYDAKWLTADDLRSNIKAYENWSQLIIKDYL